MNAELAEVQTQQVASATRVLVVDDEVRMLSSLEALLKFKNYSVDTALGGQAACQLLAQNQYDLLLLDLNMGDFDGYAVMAFMADKGIDVVTVVVSGETAFDAVRKALRMGASDYVKKPYSPEELFATIDSTMHKKSLRDERDRYQSHVRESEALYRYIVDRSPDIVFLLNNEGMFSFSNSQMESLLGYDSGQLLGLPFVQLLEKPHRQVLELFDSSNVPVSAEGVHNIELCLNHHSDSGDKKYFELTLFPVQTDIMGVVSNLEFSSSASDRVTAGGGDAFAGFYGTARDITERKKSERLIRFQAYHDLLTELPNRSLFNDRLKLAIAHARRHSQMLAVMFLDLDRFKSVNDTFGHAVGDRLLKTVVNRLQKCLREGDTLSRFGGDEFVLLLPEVNGEEVVQSIAEKIIKTVKQPFELEGQDVFVGISIGVALYPEYGGNLDALIKNADIAMYQAKKRGKNGYCLFNEAMSSDISHSIKLESELHRALENDELRVFYQPQLCAKTQTIVGVEALVRWQHPERGLVPPGEFIALAEETKLIVEIGEWVLQRACQEVKSWMDQGVGPIRLAVNFSSLQVERPNLVDTVIDTLERYQFPPRYFELEITESVMMNDLEGMVSKLQKLADYGVEVAIDDFGTGYSSLSYLHRLPIHTVKVDQSFVRNIQTPDVEVSIVNAICAMAHGLKLKIIAEGVETQIQHDYLSNLGCEEMQGYLISRPLPGDEVLDFLREREA